MPRYCVTVTWPEAHFVEANSMAEASELGIICAVERVRPAYYLAPQADVEVCGDESDTPNLPPKWGVGSIGSSAVVVVARETDRDSSTGPLGAENEVSR